MDVSRSATDSAVARVFREVAGRLTASLVRLLGDFDRAEDLVQDALLAALEHWPREGIPERPGAWLLTTARRRAVVRCQAPGRSGMPSRGQCSSAASRASWTRSSAWSKSPSSRTRDAVSRPASSRKTRATAVSVANRLTSILTSR
jgi:DNA-directed RNA polymerase specialized sigma24 family protein